MKKRNSRGFSLAEAIIALAVVATATASALTVVLAARSARRTIMKVAEAQEFAKNAVVCFQASESEEEFLEHLRFAEDAEMTEVQNGVYRYTSAKNDFTARVELSFSDTQKDTFEISVTDNDGDDIVSLNYQKGGGEN